MFSRCPLQQSIVSKGRGPARVYTAAQLIFYQRYTTATATAACLDLPLGLHSSPAFINPRKHAFSVRMRSNNHVIPSLAQPLALRDV